MGCSASKSEPRSDDQSLYDLRTKSAVIAARWPKTVPVVAGNQYMWCTCGRSKTQPFCDGSHEGTEFRPLAWTAPKTENVRLCTCKQTKNAPFCDYSHVFSIFK